MRTEKLSEVLGYLESTTSEVVQINVFRCQGCGKIHYVVSPEALWTDPVIDPPEGWEIVDKPNEPLWCSDCIAKWKEKK